VHSTKAGSSYAACASGGGTGRHTSWHKDRSTKVPERSRSAQEHSKWVPVHSRSAQERSKWVPVHNTKAGSSYAACASDARTGCTCDRKDHSRMVPEHSRSAQEHNRTVQGHSHSRASGSRTYRLGRWRQRRKSDRQPTTQGKQNGHSSRGLQLDSITTRKNKLLQGIDRAPGKQDPC